MATNIKDSDITTCDRCSKECEFNTLTYNKGSKYEWVCDNCDTKPKEEYDDHGVLCRYTEEEGWVPIEDHCEECGYKECECDEEEEEHECDEDDCEKCRRGKYCDCADNRCPYCSVKMGFK